MENAQNLRCLVVDDEPLALDLIASYVTDTPFLTLVATCSCGADALTYLQQGNVDLAFLDIQMPQLNGLELSRMAGKCAVVFTTAFEQYAVEGFKVNAIDYLLKPFSYAEFLTAANRAAQRIALERTALEHSRQGNEAPQPTSAPAPRSLMVRAEYRQQIIDFEDIIYLESLGDYVHIHLCDGSVVETLMTLKAVEELLPVSFVRVHRSFIVSLPKVKVIERNRIVFGNTYIPISDTYKDAFYGQLPTS